MRDRILGVVQALGCASGMGCDANVSVSSALRPGACNSLRPQVKAMKSSGDEDIFLAKINGDGAGGTDGYMTRIGPDGVANRWRGSSGTRATIAWSAWRRPS